MTETHDPLLWKCPVCDRQGVGRKVGSVDWYTPMPGVSHYDIRKCEHCLVEFSDPIPSDEVLAEYYGDYKPTQLSEDDSRFQYLLELQDPLVDYLSSVLDGWQYTPPRFLDYGFGAGSFMLRIAQRKYDISGIDYGNQAITQFSNFASRQGLEIKLYDFLNNGLKQLAGQRFNCITLFQVIEHLQSPVSVLKELRTLQEPGDYIYIECPNQDGWFFKLKNLIRPLIARQFMWGSVSPPQHLFGFNRKSLSTALEKAGYEVCEVGDYGMGDPLHAPETQNWYPSVGRWWREPRRHNFYGTAKMLIRLLEFPATRLFGAGGGLFALARATQAKG